MTTDPHPGGPPPAAVPPIPRRARPNLRSRFGNWAFSLVAMIVIPLFPLFVEAMKNHGKIRDENYLLTGAVLAATFGFTSEGNLFRAAYVLLFLASLGYDFHPESMPAQRSATPWTSAIITTAPGIFGNSLDWISGHPAIDLLIMVGGLHVIERFIWHLVQDRRFPDWLKGP
jgi:hypothetical protein